MTKETKVIDMAAAKEKSVLEYNREKYGQVIRRCRIAQGLNQPQLAELLNVHKNYVSHWEAGRARPDMNILPQLCGILKISADEFLGMEGKERKLSDEEKRLVNNYSMLSEQSRLVIRKTIEAMLECEEESRQKRCAESFIRIHRNEQKACAGVFNPLDDDDNGDYADVRVDELTRRADEIIIVSGDSMEPTFFDGDELLIEYTNEPGCGDLCVLVINGEGFVKEYRNDGVYSHNSALYPFRKFEPEDEIRCIGRVIGKLDSSYYPTDQEQIILNEMKRDHTR